MTYYRILPEVAGGLGDNTEIDSKSNPPIVHKLHYVFEGWLGDDIIESFPCYLVTRRLSESLRESVLVGFSFDSVELSKSKNFVELYGDVKLPEFWWMKINGKKKVSDFWISDDGVLELSERAWILIRKFNVSQVDVEMIDN